MRGNNSNEGSGATQSATRTSSRRRKSDTPQAPPALLFEIAWEVCTQVGGIYTVLRSKAPATVRRWGDEYCLIGPYWEATSKLELEPQEPQGVMKEVIDVLSVGGLRVHFGRWLITGRPQVS
jgi:glycogen(starch) synthase